MEPLVGTPPWRVRPPAQGEWPSPATILMWLRTWAALPDNQVLRWLAEAGCTHQECARLLARAGCTPADLPASPCATALQLTLPRRLIECFGPAPVQALGPLVLGWPFPLDREAVEVVRAAWAGQRPGLRGRWAGAILRVAGDAPSWRVVEVAPVADDLDAPVWEILPDGPWGGAVSPADQAIVDAWVRALARRSLESRAP